MTVQDPPAPVSRAISNASLAQRAYRIRRHALLMGEVQGQGYIAQALGIADVLAVSYFHAMTYRADDPEWEGRDRFLLSIGHYAIALYAALIEAAIIPEEEIPTYGADDSRLPMSGMAAYTPGMEITGGSLGQGLPIAIGVALGLRRKSLGSFVYTLFSDGELDEGATWEAAMSASTHRLANLIGIVDVNNMQADGPSTGIMAFEPLGPKFEAFGWFVQRVDGNDLDALTTAFDRARHHDWPGPRIVICDTKMGRGVPFLEARERNHFLNVGPEEWSQALEVLDAARPL
ncbi:transketolase [Lichenicoccus roseus]|uniref:transketolase n=1 Tax=Lichenicoccus roseus TaxID=2683649 RepID=UPI0014866ECF|nr:transketolase [Lichenicoccus roseus]